MSTVSKSSRALLVVDTQVGVLATCINADSVVATIAQLVDRAREHNTAVIWVRQTEDPSSESELVEGNDAWQFVDKLTPRPDEPIIDKRYHDAFADTELDDRLRSLGVETVLLCGAQTDACIRSTFYGGIYHGYSVTLVEDAHTTEDLTQWGAGFTPEQSIAVLNLHAADTSVPGATGATVAAADVFANN